MNGPEFLAVDLAFGRHAGRRELAPGEPVLIAGPNGSGKTTLVDGLLRTIYGFRRRLPGDRRLADARRPWAGGAFRSAVRLLTAGGEVLDWSRDHASGEVVVRTAGGEERFAGGANPGSRGSSDREYWRLVREVFGVDELDKYARTAWIGQGSVLGTNFDADLLRLAEGGHARVQRALDDISARHRELTRDPVAPDVSGARRLGSDRRLEHERKALADARTALADARDALRARGPADQRLRAVDGEMAGLAVELDRLETARTRMLERRRLEAEAADAGQRVDRLVQLRDELAEAQRDVRACEGECELRGSAEDFPADFPALATRLRSDRDEESRLSRLIEATERRLAESMPPGGGAIIPPIALLVAAIGAGLALSGAVSGWMGLGMWAVALAGVGVAIQASQRRAERRGRQRTLEAQLRREQTELETVRHRVRTALDQLPATVAAGPRLLAEHVERFERARAAERRLEEARRHHHEAARRANECAEARAVPGRALSLLLADAERRLGDVEADLRELDEHGGHGDEPGAGRGAVDRPAPSSPQAAAAGIAECRRRHDELREEREDLLVRLDRSSRAASDVARLEAEAAELGVRAAETERSVRAHRTAHALLRDGYAEFREHDEARLVAAVSARLERLGDPPLGPFRAEEGLGGPTVELGGRRTPIDSPELSHAQRHLVMFAVRLGAADFLAAEGPAAPLIIDEPFAHLDDGHAAQVWKLLRDLSVDRQVIVTTQNTALLDRLGLAPTIRLPADRIAGDAAAAAPADETRRPRSSFEDATSTSPGVLGREAP